MTRKAVFCIVCIVFGGVTLFLHGFTYQALDSFSGVMIAGAALLAHWHSNRGRGHD